MPEERIAEAIDTIKQELDERLKMLREAGKLLEAQRLSARTRFDIEMLHGSRATARASRTTAGRFRAGRRARRPTRCYDFFPERFPADRRRVARDGAADSGDVQRRPAAARRRWSSTASGCRARSTTGR